MSHTSADLESSLLLYCACGHTYGLVRKLQRTCPLLLDNAEEICSYHVRIGALGLYHHHLACEAHPMLLFQFLYDNIALFMNGLVGVCVCVYVIVCAV